MKYFYRGFLFFKVIYVVDTSNLCQISAAAVMLYTLLAEPKLKKAKVNLSLVALLILVDNTRMCASFPLPLSVLPADVYHKATSYY